jgi:uncharacterized protein
MIIDLANLGNSVKKIELSFDQPDIDLEGELVTLEGVTHFSGETEKIGSRGRVRGEISTDVSFECTRCLEPIPRHLQIPFEAVFIDAAEEDTSSEKEVADEQLDESLVEDGRVDMAEVVREQILLAIPEQIFCRDDCRGLCAKCGANLNLIDCKCADDDIDPRWAALRNLR